MKHGRELKRQRAEAPPCCGMGRSIPFITAFWMKTYSNDRTQPDQAVVPLFAIPAPDSRILSGAYGPPART